MNALGKRIETFRALLYKRKMVGDTARVVAPAYDLIGAARQNQLYERSPYNIVRLELGREADRYAAAEKTLADWIAARVLVRAERPAIYQYTQSFDVEGRVRHVSGVRSRDGVSGVTPGRIAAA